jgi:hypothetical protein
MQADHGPPQLAQPASSAGSTGGEFQRTDTSVKVLLRHSVEMCGSRSLVCAFCRFKVTSTRRPCREYTCKVVLLRNLACIPGECAPSLSLAPTLSSVLPVSRPQLLACGPVPVYKHTHTHTHNYNAHFPRVPEAKSAVTCRSRLVGPTSSSPARFRRDARSRSLPLLDAMA